MANSKTMNQWLRYSVRDLKLAQNILMMGPEMKYGAAFHAQQCVEKAIKAYLVFQEIRPPKTHDIEQLANLISEVEPKLALLINKSKRLTRFAVAYRYPDAELRSVSFLTIKNHVKKAHVIYDYVFQIVKG